MEKDLLTYWRGTRGNVHLHWHNPSGCSVQIEAGLAVHVLSWILAYLWGEMNFVKPKLEDTVIKKLEVNGNLAFSITTLHSYATLKKSINNVENILVSITNLSDNPRPIILVHLIFWQTPSNMLWRTRSVSLYSSYFFHLFDFKHWSKEATCRMLHCHYQQNQKQQIKFSYLMTYLHFFQFPKHTTKIPLILIQLEGSNRAELIITQALADRFKTQLLLLALCCWVF